MMYLVGYLLRKNKDVLFFKKDIAFDLDVIMLNKIDKLI